MRLRRYKKVCTDAFTESKRQEEKAAPPEKTTATAAPFKLRNPLGIVNKVINNPNLTFQLMVIGLTLLSDNVPIDARLNGITSSVEKIRSVTEVVNNTMQSLKVAAEAPKNIRRLME
ncbi:MAG: hypothetical protein LLG02_17010 [Pelosinus sp.]|nr:hypothetical protein [Pelosinus sp.]